MARLTEAQVKKQNRATTEFLVGRLRTIPAKILGRLTNATVLAAVTNTYQDSGRFNWNWRVSWQGETRGGIGHDKSTEYGVPPVGERSWPGGPAPRGMGHGTVIEAQWKEIGFMQTGFARGRLYQDIVKDNPTRVTVFNPYYAGRYGLAAVEGKLGTAAKVSVPAKIEAAVAREAARTQHELKYKG
jgi:hypothetical protein